MLLRAICSAGCAPCGSCGGCGWGWRCVCGGALRCVCNAAGAAEKAVGCTRCSVRRGWRRFVEKPLLGAFSSRFHHVYRMFFSRFHHVLLS